MFPSNIQEGGPGLYKKQTEQATRSKPESSIPFSPTLIQFLPLDSCLEFTDFLSVTNSYLEMLDEINPFLSKLLFGHRIYQSNRNLTKTEIGIKSGVIKYL